MSGAPPSAPASDTSPRSDPPTVEKPDTAGRIAQVHAGPAPIPASRDPRLSPEASRPAMNTLLAPPDQSPPDGTEPVSSHPSAPTTDLPTRRVVRRGVGVLAIRVVGLGSTTLAALLLGRLLGPARLGVYEAAMAWAAVLVVPVLLGFDRLVLRETAARRDPGERSTADVLFRTAQRGVSLTACVVAVAAAELAALGLLDPTKAWVAVTFVPTLALLRLGQSRLQAHGKVIVGSVAELVVLPTMFLALLGIAWAADLRTPAAALTGQALAAGTALLLVVLLGRGLPSTAPTDGPATTPIRIDWRGAVLPLTVLALLQILNARIGVLMMDGLATDAEVGRFSIAYRIAGLVQIPLLAVNAALGPSAAELHARGDRAGLQAVVTRCARQAFGFGALIALCVLGLGGVVLDLLGSGFDAAHPALLTLVAAQLANVAMGSVGLLLLMTGHERPALFGLGLGIAASVGLGLVLIPALGGLGAAMATGLGLVVWNVALWWMVRRRLGIAPTIFARGRRPQEVAP